MAPWPWRQRGAEGPPSASRRRLRAQRPPGPSEVTGHHAPEMAPWTGLSGHTITSIQSLKSDVFNTAERLNEGSGALNPRTAVAHLRPLC